MDRWDDDMFDFSPTKVSSPSKQQQQQLEQHATNKHAEKENKEPDEFSKWVMTNKGKLSDSKAVSLPKRQPLFSKTQDVKMNSKQQQQAAKSPTNTAKNPTKKGSHSFSHDWNYRYSINGNEIPEYSSIQDKHCKVTKTSTFKVFLHRSSNDQQHPQQHYAAYQQQASTLPSPKRSQSAPKPQRRSNSVSTKKQQSRPKTTTFPAKKFADAEKIKQLTEQLLQCEEKIRAQDEKLVKAKLDASKLVELREHLKSVREDRETKERIIYKLKEKMETLQERIKALEHANLEHEKSIKTRDDTVNELRMQLVQKQPTEAVTSQSDTQQEVGGKKLEKSLHDAKRDNKQLVSEVDMLKTQMQLLRQNERNREEEYLAEMNKLRKRIGQEQEKISQLKEKTRECDRLQERVNKLTSMFEREKEEAKKNELQHKKLLKSIELQKQQVESMQDETNRVKSDCTHANDELIKARELISQERSKVIHLEEEKANFVQKMKEATKKMEEFEAVHLKQAKIHEEERNNLRRMMQKVTALEKEKSDLEERSIVLKNEIAAYEKQEDSYRQLRRDSDDKERLSQSLQEKIIKLQNQLDDVQKQYDQNMDISNNFKTQLQTEKNNKGVADAALKEYKAKIAALTNENAELVTAKQLATKQIKFLEEQVKNTVNESKDLEFETTIADLRRRLREAEERSKVLSESNRMLLMRLKREEEARKKDATK